MYSVFSILGNISRGWRTIEEGRRTPFSRFAIGHWGQALQAGATEVGYTAGVLTHFGS